MSGIVGIEKARSIFNATKRLQYADLPLLDIADRISVLSVAAGLRPVGVLEAEGLQLARIKDVLISHGLSTWQNKTADGRAALWFAGDPATRRNLKGQPQTDAQIGLTLSYPQCCVKANGDRSGILEAITSEEELKEAMKNVPASAEKFPFVSHVACDLCLNTQQSPSEKINAENEAVASEVDPSFSQLASYIAKEARAIENEATRNQAINKISAMHRTFFKSQ